MQKQSGLRQRFGARWVERKRAALGSQGIRVARQPGERQAQIIERLPVPGAEPPSLLIGAGGTLQIASLEQKMTQPDMQAGLMRRGRYCHAQPMLVICRRTVVLVRQKTLRPPHEYNRRWVTGRQKPAQAAVFC